MANEGHEHKGKVSKLQADPVVPQEGTQEAQEATFSEPTKPTANQSYTMAITPVRPGVSLHIVKTPLGNIIGTKNTGPLTRDGEQTSVKYYGAIVADADGPYVFGWAKDTDEITKLTNDAKASKITVLAVVIPEP